MKQVILFAAACFTAVLVLSPAAGAADSSVYFAGRAGITLPEDSDVHFDSGYEATFEYDTGYSFAAAIGTRVNQNLRIEPEISYQENDLDQASDSTGSISVNGDVSILAFMANMYYDFTPDARATPYIGGGVGYAQVDVSNITSPSAPGTYLEGDDDNVFCYQATAGVAWAMGNDMTMDVSYRYFATEDPSFEISDAEFASHNFYLGIRVPF